MSGGKLDRPVLADVRELVKCGELRKLYVFRLDRLTRSGVRDTLSLVEELKRGGCQLVTIADGLDFEGPGAEMVIASLSFAARLEREKIRENLAAARARVERAGGSWGRPPQVTKDTLRSIRAKRREGATIREIAIALKVPRSTVADVLSGKYRYAAKLGRAQKKPLKKG